MINYLIAIYFITLEVLQRKNGKLNFELDFSSTIINKPFLGICTDGATLKQETKMSRHEFIKTKEQKFQRRPEGISIRKTTGAWCRNSLS